MELREFFVHPSNICQTSLRQHLTHSRYEITLPYTFLYILASIDWLIGSRFMSRFRIVLALWDIHIMCVRSVGQFTWSILYFLVFLEASSGGPSRGLCKHYKMFLQLLRNCRPHAAREGLITCMCNFCAGTMPPGMWWCKLTVNNWCQVTVNHLYTTMVDPNERIVIK